ncbi:DegQ family serine endoprotease [Pontiella agarivorans]|uniref:DegQ family serine endoprotease n=1 Tax=Pontiella agarivorans TaxID=3038953 RepID=A0ABU5MYT4_9BACT|nr:DegQ family serine endoprotease [Pontiella agarivorans]MDZ8119324.1 DegQ family serine endoprotease [Pontiella agarivorans]
MRVVKYLTAGVAAVALFGAVPAEAGKAALEQTGNAFAEVAEEALPAVVFIDVETTVEMPASQYRNPFEEFFGRGYGGYQRGPETREYHQRGQGSGFIISKDGYILTNNHVVNDADKITVTLGDGREFDAQLIGTDPKTEVALIKIDGDDELPVVSLGNSDELRVGEWVIAAGNPFGLSQTITAGIVSAKGRDETNIAEYGNFIQTDAAINPGNSGGPLLNIDGEVVGINTAIYTRSGGYMGIGFAIPINQAVNIKDQLIKYGKVSRSVLGVYLQEVDEDLAATFGLEQKGGVLINQVVEGSAAEEAGIKGGDIVVGMNGKPVVKLHAFRNRVANTPPNSKIELKVFRDGKYIEISAITKEMESDDSGAVQVDDSTFDKLGISVESMEGDTARRMGYEDIEGVIITEVEQGSAAWNAGLQPGQVITTVNRKPIDSVKAFKKAVSENEGHRILFLITDGRVSRFVVVNLDD